MKHYLSKITAKVTAAALREAEAILERPETKADTVDVMLRPQEISERLELFQPRRPGYGTQDLDGEHVKKLKVRIERKGDMDPIWVIKLGREFIVIDGHHRLEAYRKLKWADPIKCIWFAGSVRDAIDISLRRNEKVHLPLDTADKAEAAWLRTILDRKGKDWSSSKADVVKITGCGEGTVAQMRRAVRWHSDQKTGRETTVQGERLLRELGDDLSAHSWNKVKAILNELEPRMHDEAAAAAKMAKSLKTRMSGKLSDDVEVTARAILLYDPELGPRLAEAILRIVKEQKTEERALDDAAAYETLSAQVH